jgi:hypothetical protein
MARVICLKLTGESSQDWVLGTIVYMAESATLIIGSGAQLLDRYCH